MDFLFLLLVIVCVLGLYLALDNRQLKRDYADLIKDRDQLRRDLKLALKNDKRNPKTGRYTK